MSKHLGDFDASTVIYGKFTTYRPSTGAPYTLAGTPALSVYKDASTTQSTTGVTLTVDFDSVTGLHHYAIDTSADGTFYSAGSFFDIVITTGTVDSVSAVGTVVGSFTIRKNSALKPATAGRTVVVDASGLVDANTVKVGPSGSGTAQTARDIGASVLLSSGTGTGQLDFTSGVVKANVTQNAGSAITSASGIQEVKVASIATGAITAGSIAADAITDAKVASDVTIASVTGAVGSVTGDVGGNVVGSVGSVTGAVGSVAGNVTGSVGSIATGGITSASFAAAAIDAAAIATDAFGALELAAGAGAEIASAVRTELTTELSRIDAAISTRFAATSAPANFSSLGINVSGHISRVTLVDTITTYTGNTVQTGDAYARLGSPTGASVSADISSALTSLSSVQSALILRTNTSQNGGATSITLDSGASSVDNAYVGAVIVQQGQARVCTAYTGSTKIATVDRAWANNPSTTTYFVISPQAAALAALAAVNSVAGSVGSVAGNVSGSVGSVTAGVTVTTNNDKTGYSLSVAPPTAAAIRTEIDSNSTQLAAIKAKTDNLPASPASASNVSDAQTAILAKLPASLVAGRIDASVGAYQSGLSPLLATNVPANFSSLLINASGHITRVTLVDTTTTNSDMRGTDNALLASGYTAPNNAGIGTILTVTNRLDTALELDGSVYRFTTNALEQAPTGSGGGSSLTVEEIVEGVSAELMPSINLLTDLAQADEIFDMSGSPFRYKLLAAGTNTVLVNKRLLTVDGDPITSLTDFVGQAKT